jgi:hypothetical protein
MFLHGTVLDNLRKAKAGMTVSPPLACQVDKGIVEKLFAPDLASDVDHYIAVVAYITTD